jgi:hypothetical protein
MTHGRKQKPARLTGVQQVTVMSATEQKSRRGDHMIVLHLAVANSVRGMFRDYLVFADCGYWKVEQFLAAVGKEVADGEVIRAYQLRRLTGYAKVGVSVDQEKPRKKNYFIVKWLPPQAIGAAKDCVVDAKPACDGGSR